VPDGLTLMLTSNGHTVAAVLNKNLPFDPVKDFSGVTQVASVPLVLIAPPDLPAKSLRELVALAKNKPGTLNFASSGLASTAYVSGELLKQTAKLDIVHVPYKGAPESLTGIMRSDSHMFFAGINIALDLIQSGKVHPLAVATSKRIASLPSVPTFAEAGMPEFEYDAWFGIMAPANTPAAVLDKISRDVDAILQLPDVRKRLESQGVITVVSTPQKFDMLIRSDTERFGKMLREAGVAAN
jgi:tripartite-type tricarboxylate transporter receptor subunit TctC